MRVARYVLLFVFLMVSGSSAWAQFSVPTTTERFDSKDLPYAIRPKSGGRMPEYFSLDRQKAIRRAIRLNRNTLEVNTRLKISTVQYNKAWSADVDNTLTGSVYLRINHVFKRNRLTLTTKGEGEYGMTKVTGEETKGEGYDDWLKTQDYFTVSFGASWALKKEGIGQNWSYNFSTDFRSQFSQTFASRTDHTKTANFMAPGYLNVSLGLKYTSPNNKLPFIVSISPISGSGTFVVDNLSNNRMKKLGMPSYTNAEGQLVYKHQKLEGGSSFQLDFSRYFDRKKIVRYTTKFYSFFGWITDLTTYDGTPAADGTVPRHIIPTYRWENTLEIKALKFMTTVVKWQLFYNRAQVDKLQLNYELSLTFAYNYKNK